MIHILFITLDGILDPLGQSQILPYTEKLRKKGFDISILSFEKKTKLIEKSKELSDKLFSLKITWYPLPYQKGIRFLSPAINFAHAILFIFFKLQLSQYNWLYCRSFIPALLGLLANKILKSRFIFDTRGFWVDERKEYGNFTNPHLFNLIKHIEQIIIKNCDYLIVQTSKAKKEIICWEYLTSSQESKIIVLPNSLELKLFQTPFHAKLNLISHPKTICFGYAGSLGTWYSEPTIKQFVRFIYKYQSSSEFTFLLNNGIAELRDFISEEQLEKNRFSIKSVTYEQIPAEFQHIDIGFFFITPSYSKIASCPTKMGEMLAAGIPIITGHSIGDVDEIISKYNIGYVVQDFTEEEFKKACDYVMNMLKTEREPLIKRCRQAAEDNFSLDKAVEKYTEIYNGLLKKLD